MFFFDKLFGKKPKDCNRGLAPMRTASPIDERGRHAFYGRNAGRVTDFNDRRK
jgi:hypothetical protein